jgi:hypothetical protein
MWHSHKMKLFREDIDQSSLLKNESQMVLIVGDIKYGGEQSRP